MKKRLLVAASVITCLFIWFLGAVPMINDLIIPNEEHVLTFYLAGDSARYVYMGDSAPSSEQLDWLIATSPVATAWKYEIVKKTSGGRRLQVVYTATGEGLEYLCPASLDPSRTAGMKYQITDLCPMADKLLGRKRRENEARCIGYSYRYCDDLRLRLPF